MDPDQRKKVPDRPVIQGCEGKVGACTADSETSRSRSRKDTAMALDTNGLERQLASWSSWIDDLAAKTLKADARTKFDAVIHVDELKALLAIAQTAFVAHGSAGLTEQAHLQTELEDACRELEAAIRTPAR
jgi:hypothetical protein